MRLRPQLVSCICYCFFLSPAALISQTELVRESLFPAEFEFKELKLIRSEHKYQALIPKGGLVNPALLQEAGLKKYSERIYELVEGGSLKLVILQLEDKRSAFSILTLLQKSDLQKGPPGDYFTVGNQSLVFAQDAFWVLIDSDRTGDLVKRVGLSVSNRIGNRASAPPSLISHLPLIGLDRSTIRYFLGKQAFDAFGKKIPRRTFEFLPGMELVQANYDISQHSGTLSLLSFPTGQLAEDFFDSPNGAELGIPDSRRRTYSKRAGPLIAILEGNFSPDLADTVLGDVKFAYSIKWIYDKNNKGSQTVWGVPVGILGTVVRSLVLVALLCLASVAAGAALALFRVTLRGYAPNNFLDRPERTEMIRLKINEN